MDSPETRDFQRLCRAIEGTRGFMLACVACCDAGSQDALIARLAAVGLSSLRVEFDAWEDEPASVIGKLRTAGVGDIVHLTGVGSRRRAGATNWHGLNYARDSFPGACPRPLLVWLQPDALTELSREAGDLWAWRTLVLDFTIRPP